MEDFIMKSLNQKDVISAIGLYADNSIKTSEIIEGFSIKVFNNLDDSQKETIIQLVEDKDFTEAKALVKLEVNKITGFDNKNTIAKYKNTLASKYYDDSKTVVYKRKHFDKDTGIDFRNDTVSISSKFSYELSEKEFKALKKSGYYSKESKTKRENKRLSDLKESMIEKVTKDFNKKVSKHKRELSINLELINQGFYISPKTGNIKGAIYYNHTDELNFNWSTEKIKESAIIDFSNNLDPVKFEGLKITNDEKELITI